MQVGFVSEIIVMDTTTGLKLRFIHEDFSWVHDPFLTEGIIKNNVFESVGFPSNSSTF